MAVSHERLVEAAGGNADCARVGEWVERTAREDGDGSGRAGSGDCS
jgi:hypothetical protein